MRRLLRLLTRRMLVKVFMVAALVVGVAMCVFAALQAREQGRFLERATIAAAEHVADMVSGGIEHAMLQGNGIAVKDLVAGFKSRVPQAEIRVYDRRGLEVFAEAPPPPASKPPEIAAALAAAQRKTLGERVFRPIPNEERCQKCHALQAGEAPLRGVLVLERDPQVLGARRGELAARALRAAFVHVMTAKQSEQLDEFFAQITRLAPSVTEIAVYDREGDLAFGHDIPGLGPEVIAAGLAPGAQRQQLASAERLVELVPLPLEERCKGCHKDKSPVRGLLAVALAPVPVDDELEAITDAGLRAIMVSSLGRIAAEFLYEVAGLGGFRQIELFDTAGRRYFTSQPAAPSALVAAALAAQAPESSIEHRGDTDWVVIPRKLENGPRCRTCHGDDHAVRGLVTVRLPNDLARMARERAILRTVEFAVAALVLMLVLLWLVLRILVVRPVAEMARAAAAVGQGDLAVRVQRADPDGDEVKRLGTSINDMIQGLRAKLVLEKFVSKGAAQAAAQNVAKTRFAVPSAGELRHVTVLFSDIRGFTAFSETVPPAEVVAMLNTFLRVQAECVEQHGGDIDKFVGDELMAVFEGDDASARAVRCAVAMIEAVAAARRPGQEMAVGVGISTGEVIYGPIGSSNRLDFTVIGDVVNTGARLCSAAQKGQVIVTRAVLDACRGGLGTVEFSPLQPLTVKGKAQPLEIYGATRVP